MLNQKGQIFSLDFILSLAIIILAIGLMLQFMELQEYNQREAEIQNELYSVGETATLILMSKPSFDATAEDEYFSCKMVDASGSVTLAPVMGCIPLFSGALLSELEITKEKLGIPSDYFCNITGKNSAGFDISGINLLPAECGTPFDPSAGNVYSSTREVVFLNGTQGAGFEERISKRELYHNCIRDNDSLGCPLETGTITLRVWK